MRTRGEEGSDHDQNTHFVRSFIKNATMFEPYLIVDISGSNSLISFPFNDVKYIAEFLILPMNSQLISSLLFFEHKYLT